MACNYLFSPNTLAEPLCEMPEKVMPELRKVKAISVYLYSLDISLYEVK